MAKSTRVQKTGSSNSTSSSKAKKNVVVKVANELPTKAPPLTDNEKKARAVRKYATTTFGFNSKNAYSVGADVSGSSQGNFYSPQLSTDFLEKPQNLRERRAWYRHFYNQNEFVGQSIDLHSMLPISKIKLDKPKNENEDLVEYVYSFFVDMCQDMKLTSKTLMEISHEYWLMGNCTPGNSLISTEAGYRKAASVRSGDKILTHLGRYKTVANTCSREADDILRFEFEGNAAGLPVTEEHPVEVLKDKIFNFKEAKDIECGDYIKAVWPLETKDVQIVNILAEDTDKPATKETKRASYIEIDKDFLYLLGYWLRCGSLDSKNGTWWVSFDKDTIKTQNKITKILTDTLSIKNVEMKPGEAINNVEISKDPSLVCWWARNFGWTVEGLNRKKLPLWIQKLPKEKLEYLVAGLVDAGESVRNTEGKPSLQISMPSAFLLYEIRDIFFKCGMVPLLTEFDTLTLIDRKSCLKATNKSVSKFDKSNKFRTLRGVKKVGDDIAFRVNVINREDRGVVYNFEVVDDHTYTINGMSTHNCFIFAEDHEPYENIEDEEKSEMKEEGKERTKDLYERFKIIDKDPNYKGFRKLVVLPPDQVRIKRLPLSDEKIVEFIPDPETKKAAISIADGDPFGYDQQNLTSHDERRLKNSMPEDLVNKLRQGGAVPLDTDPYAGSHVYHLARKKSQYETLGTSILERCINTLLLHDKLRQAQQSIASRHMTPIRIVWAEELSENDVDNLREQVDLALVDPDFSIITNFQVNWEEMGSNGRLLELSSEYEHIENSLFAGLGVTREILTGEGMYSGNRISLEILNTQYLLFRELLIDFIENNIFKPVAKKKGFVDEDKFGRKTLIYPRVSFSRLAIRDNDAFFDQAFNMYNKGSLSVDVILDMMNIDPVTTRKKIEADLFTVNDPAFNQLMQQMYNSLGQMMAEKFDVSQQIADYLKLQPLPEPEGEEGEGGEGLGGGGGGLEGMSRFASTLSNKRQAALSKIIDLASKNPKKLDALSRFFEGRK